MVHVTDLNSIDTNKVSYISSWQELKALTFRIVTYVDDDAFIDEANMQGQYKIAVQIPCYSPSENLVILNNIISTQIYKT